MSSRLMVAAAFLLSAMIGSGQTIAYDAVIQPGNQAWTGNLGLDFDVTTKPILVTALGAFDNNGDGFSGTVQVQIFDRDTSAVVGPSVSLSGTNGIVVNGDRFISVTPFQLPVGHYSVVAVGFNATDLDGNVSLGPPYVASTQNGGGLISFVGSGRFDGNAALDFPGTVPPGLPTNPFLAGTFQFQGFAAPLVSKTFATTFGIDLNLGETTQVIITLTNTNPAPLTSLSLVDILPDGLTPGNPLNFNYTCAPLTATSMATGSGTVIITGSIAARTTCTLRFDVVATEPGSHTNIILPVTTAEAPPSAQTSATVYVQWSWLWFFFSN